MNYLTSDTSILYPSGLNPIILLLFLQSLTFNPIPVRYKASKQQANNSTSHKPRVKYFLFSTFKKLLEMTLFVQKCKEIWSRPIVENSTLFLRYDYLLDTYDSSIATRANIKNSEMSLGKFFAILLFTIQRFLC